MSEELPKKVYHIPESACVPIPTGPYTPHFAGDLIGRDGPEASPDIGIEFARDAYWSMIEEVIAKRGTAVTLLFSPATPSSLTLPDEPHIVE